MATVLYPESQFLTADSVSQKQEPQMKACHRAGVSKKITLAHSGIFSLQFFMNVSNLFIYFWLTHLSTGSDKYLHALFPKFQILA